MGLTRLMPAGAVCPPPMQADFRGGEPLACRQATGGAFLTAAWSHSPPRLRRPSRLPRRRQHNSYLPTAAAAAAAAAAVEGRCMRACACVRACVLACVRACAVYRVTKRLFLS